MFIGNTHDGTVYKISDGQQHTVDRRS